MKKKLVINADDFGLTPGVNYGILDSFLRGVLTSTTLMVNQPYAIHATELAKRYPELGIGIHITFDKGKALSGVSSLTDENGVFKSFAGLLIDTKKEDFFKEAECQIERFKEILGRMPTHIDSHHHVHIKNSKAFEAITELSQKMGLKLRRSENLIGEFYDKNVSWNALKNMLEKNQKDFVEVMCHPAFVDKALIATSSYNHRREDELEILVDEEVKKYIRDNYELVSYDGKIKKI